jgi:hypothetical protein
VHTTGSMIPDPLGAVEHACGRLAPMFSAGEGLPIAPEQGCQWRLTLVLSRQDTEWSLNAASAVSRQSQGFFTSDRWVLGHAAPSLDSDFMANLMADRSGDGRRMTPNMLATTTLVTRRRPMFQVTPKGRTAEGDRKARVPALLGAILVLTVLACGWYVLTLMGLTPVHYEVPWAVHAAFGWMLVNAVLVWLAIRRVRASRYGSERRSSVRFTIELGARLDGIEAMVRDVSLTGARIEVPALTVLAQQARLRIDVPGGAPVELTGENRSIWTDVQGRRMIGFEFDGGQIAAQARLAAALFRVDEPANQVLAAHGRPVVANGERPAIDANAA